MPTKISIITCTDAHRPCCDGMHDPRHIIDKCHDLTAERLAHHVKAAYVRKTEDAVHPVTLGRR